VAIQPHESVLLAVGRRDRMCGEFLEDGSDPSHLLSSNGVARFEFALEHIRAGRPALLGVHTADQSKEISPEIEVLVNGKSFKQTIPAGLGLQKDDLHHLAFAKKAKFELPAGTLRAGKNEVEVRVRNDGWFTWDAMDVICSNREN
jgi:hypothetical protein